jgi:hypothetical protein
MDYILERSREEIKSVGGLCLIGRALERIGFSDAFTSSRTADILKTEIALLCQGRADFNDVELFRHDAYFAESLGLKRVPSEPTLRQGLDACDNAVRDAIRKVNLAGLRHATFTPVRTRHGSYIPVDIDVSPFDNSNSKKEGVSWTYKKVAGYSPTFSYVGAEGWLLDCELRPGSQHSQKGTPEFLRRNIASLRELGILPDCLVRMDSAHDAAENLRILSEARCKLLIKRNLRQESRPGWITLAKAVGEREEPRQGKRVWRGVVSHIQPPRDEDEQDAPDLSLFVVFEVVERTTDGKGQTLLFPEYEVDTWWTNLPDAPEEVIQLYHGHGTSEQFHSELKTDMGLERLPSGKFATNATVLLLAGVAYNLLRTLGQEALRRPETLPIRLKVKRRRLASVMRDLIYIACKRVRHAGSVFLKFGRSCPWLDTFRAVYKSLAPRLEPA